MTRFRIAATACLTICAGLAGAKLAGIIDWSWWSIAAPVVVSVLITIGWIGITRLIWPAEDDPDVWH